jgi:hypothetical protein
VKVWGIERTVSFRDDTGQADFVTRLVALEEHRGGSPSLVVGDVA